MNPAEMVMAIGLTQRDASSALPNAPVIDDRKSTRQPVQNLRLATARALRRTADRVEPKSCAVNYG
jgi:hypothetical protein